PITIDSGIPSNTDPSAIASAAAPPAPATLADRLRWRAPRAASMTVPRVNAAAPARKPSTDGSKPPVRRASSISSNAMADTSTPEPNAMTPAVTLADGVANQPSAAPSSSELPASKPQNNAGINSIDAPWQAGRGYTFNMPRKPLAA